MIKGYIKSGRQPIGLGQTLVIEMGKISPGEVPGGGLIIDYPEAIGFF